MLYIRTKFIGHHSDVVLKIYGQTKTYSITSGKDRRSRYSIEAFF